MSKVTLDKRYMHSGSRTKNMQFYYDKPSHMPAYPGRKYDKAAIAIRNIIIYCEIAHKDTSKKELAKRFGLSLNSISTFYYKTAEKIRAWKEQGLK